MLEGGTQCGPPSAAERRRKKFGFLGGGMSVLKNKRGLSKLEFYHNARNLRKNLTSLLLRDFGIHVKVKGQDKQDEEQEEIVSGTYPEWLLINFRESIMRILRNLIINITAGNSIYPTDMKGVPAEYGKRVLSDDLADRRRYQTAAIINCEQLVQELQYCTDVLPIKMEKLLPYIESVEFEIRLLKGWRKSTNDLAKKLGN
jgi:hypothetical protein